MAERPQAAEGGAPGRIVLPPHRARARRPFADRARDWIRHNLFPSRLGALLTLFSFAVLVALTAGVVWYVFFGADWGVVSSNRWLLFAGSFPSDQEWRLWAGVGVVFLMIGVAYGLWSRFNRRDLLFLALASVFLIFLMAHGSAAIWSTIWFLIALALMLIGYAIAIRVPRDGGPLRARANRIGIALLALALPLVLVILMAGGGAETSEFDGFVLNVILAPVGIVGGLIVALPLAIGRASSLKAISWTCTAYIEIVRGAPLLGWLFVALFILEDVIGGSLLIRTMVVLAVFTGAYMAEYIRGGLQALPGGQDEAARAVGLTRRQTLQTIIMPQALRVSIPPLVGQAISIWKDTSLVSVILPMRELKGNADSAIAQTEFLADRIEVYVFVAVIFWIVAFTMSRISQRVERAQGVGER